MRNKDTKTKALPLDKKLQTSMRAGSPAKAGRTLANEKQRKKMYDQIIQYANILYDRNLKSFGTMTTVMDIVSEVYAIGYSSEEDVVRVVRNVIFKEKRRLLAIRQQRQRRELTGEKVCNKCHMPKPIDEFYTRVDTRTGFRYLCNNCKSCEKDRRFDYNSKKRNEKNRELVRNDLQLREPGTCTSKSPKRQSTHVRCEAV